MPTSSFKDKYQSGIQLSSHYDELTVDLMTQMAELVHDTRVAKGMGVDAIQGATDALGALREDVWIPDNVKARLKGTSVTDPINASPAKIVIRCMRLLEVFSTAYIIASEDRDALAEAANRSVAEAEAMLVGIAGLRTTAGDDVTSIASA